MQSLVGRLTIGLMLAAGAAAAAPPPPQGVAREGIEALEAQLDRAVDRVSLDVRRGEVFGLLGPNGAGKTTFISCLAGLLTPASGSLWFDGQAFTPRTRPEQRAQLGLVPQETAVYDELSARENLDLFARLLGAADVDAAVAAGLALVQDDARQPRHVHDAQRDHGHPDDGGDRGDLLRFDAYAHGGLTGRLLPLPSSPARGRAACSACCAGS